METLLMVSSLITALITATGAGAESDDRGWQLKKLFSPTSRNLAHEAAGHVFIFDGLLDTDVRQAMQRDFERIGSKMFARTRITDRSGALLQDETGGHVAEDEDCD
jgi:hypothetical protein